MSVKKSDLITEEEIGEKLYLIYLVIVRVILFYPIKME